MDKNDIKFITVTLFVMGILFFITGGTFAYWTWNSSNTDNTNVVFTTSAGFSCSANGGGNITSSDKPLAPAKCTDPKYAIKRTVSTNVTNNRGSNISLDMWLNVNQMSDGLRNSDNFKYVLSTSSTSCDANVVSSGTFKNIADGGKVSLLDEQPYASSKTDTYYLYIWLDEAEESTSTMNQTFSLSLGGVCSDKPVSPKPNKPVLDEGMIPVKIANDGSVTAISEDDTSWYNYKNKEWANVVLVKESGVRTRTANKVAGTTIDRKDILAYYVWIPRYSYQVWTTGVSATGQEQEINIMFESLSTPKSVATKVGDYYTHPAFTFGDQELSGIWVGKFETTGTSDSPTILDGSPLRGQPLSILFAASQKFGTNTYGMTNQSDAHMMKNSEWGVVAYLSRSKYGINDEIRINNYFSYRTGCGALAPNATYSSTCDLKYGSGISEYSQSTTGNISGIFDMSGGTEEYVMANYNNTLGSSGFETMPDSKYYDLYTINDMLLCTLAFCGGHALNETSGWYDDSFAFVSSTGPWFRRGGYNTNGKSAGAFKFYRTAGDASMTYASRSVIVSG